MAQISEPTLKRVELSATGAVQKPPAASGARIAVKGGHETGACESSAPLSGATVLRPIPIDCLSVYPVALHRS